MKTHGFARKPSDNGRSNFRYQGHEYIGRSRDISRSKNWQTHMSLIDPIRIFIDEERNLVRQNFKEPRAGNRSSKYSELGALHCNFFGGSYLGIEPEKLTVDPLCGRMR